MEPMIELHEAALKELKHIVKEVHSGEILAQGQAIERLREEKVERIQHENDMFTLKTSLYDQ